MARLSIMRVLDSSTYDKRMQWSQDEIDRQEWKLESNVFSLVLASDENGTTQVALACVQAGTSTAQLPSWMMQTNLSLLTPWLPHLVIHSTPSSNFWSVFPLAFDWPTNPTDGLDTIMDHPVSSLLTLSDELRLNIFRYLFEYVTFRVGGGRKTCNSVNRYPTGLAIFLVCKQLYRDSALLEAFHLGAFVKIGGHNVAKITEGELCRFKQIMTPRQLSLTKCDIFDSLTRIPNRVAIQLMDTLQNIRELHMFHDLICDCWRSTTLRQLESAPERVSHQYWACQKNCRDSTTMLIDQFFNALVGRLKSVFLEILRSKRMILIMRTVIILRAEVLRVKGPTVFKGFSGFWVSSIIRMQKSLL